MERINISLTKQQLQWLREQRDKTGIGISELIRRLVDEQRIQDGNNTAKG